MHNAPANIISPWKRALSTFVALALAATMCPASALADEVADKEASAPVEAVSGDRALVAASSSAAAASDAASAAPEASAEPFAPESPDEPEGAPKIISQTQQVAASPESADDEASAGEVIYRSGIGYALDEQERTAAIADVTAAAGAELFIPRAIECDGEAFEVASVLPGAIAADSSIVGFKADEESRFAAQDAALYAIDADDEGELYAALIWHAPASGEAFVVPESIEHGDGDIPVRAIGQAAFRSSADLKSIITRADIEQIARAEEADSAPSEGKLPSEQAPVAAFAEEALEDIVVTLIDGADDAAWQEAGFAHIERIFLPEPEQGDEPAAPEEPEQPDVPAAPEAPAAEGALAYTLRPDCTLEASWEGPAPRAGTIVVPAAAELAGTLYPVTAIAKGAFADAKWLTGIELASSVTRIEEGAFAGCTGLTSVKLSEGLRVIDYAAFEGATALKHLVIPSTLVALGGSALAGCSSLATMVFLPVSATIGEGAFAGTTDLTIYSCGGIGAQAPASSIAVHPVGVTLATDPLQLKVGESASIFEGGALEDAGIGKCSYAYGAAICAVDADGNVTATAPGTEQVIVELSIMGTPVAKAARAVSVKAVASPMIAADADLSSLDPEERERAEQGANAGVSSELLGSFVRQASGRTMSLLNVPVALSSDEMPLTTIDPATMSMETDHIIYAALYGEPDSGNYTLWIGTSREGDSTLGKLAYGIWSGVGQSTAADNAPWSKYAASITSVVIEDSPAKPVKPKSTAYWFSGLANVSSFGSQLAHIGTSDVLSMSFMFYQCGAVTSLDLSSFDMSSVADMSYMFRSCTSLTSVSFSSTGTPKLENMAHMFRGCGKLTSLDLSKFTTARVTQMNELFRSCSKLAALDISSFDTSSVTNMYYLFFGCSALSALDLRHFDTSQVTNMAGMFSGCSGLASLDVSGFKTGNVADMSYMFSSCSNLISLSLSNFDVRNVADMSYMFHACSKLKELDVASFSTSKVVNMACMFNNCSALVELDVSRFDTSNVTDMNNMFYGCTVLSSLDLSNFNTSKVVQMNGMFGRTTNLHELDLSGFNTSNVTSFASMFSNARNLYTLDLSGFDLAKATTVNSMFVACRELRSLDLSGWAIPAGCNTTALFSSCGQQANGRVDITGIKLSPAFRFSADATSMSNGLFLDGVSWYADGKGEAMTPVQVKDYYTNGNAAADIIWTTTKSAETVTVTFEIASTAQWYFVDTGKKTRSYTVPVGTYIGAPGVKETTNEGSAYRLMGWSSQSGQVVAEIQPGQAVLADADKTYYDVYKAKDINYIYLDSNYESAPAGPGPLEVKYQAAILVDGKKWSEAGTQMFPASQIPTRSGWVFTGYYDTPAPETDAEGNVTSNGNLMITSAGTLTTTGAGYANTPAAMQDATWYARWVPAAESTGIYAALYDGPDSGFYTLWMGTSQPPNTINFGGKSLAKAFGSYNNIGSSYQWAENQPWEAVCDKVMAVKIADRIQPTYTSHLFHNNSSLQSVNGRFDLSNLDTSKTVNMDFMFDGCTSLQSVPGIETWDTSNVDGMGRMFYNCSALEELDLSSFDTSSVRNMGRMFNGCSTLTSLDVSSFDTAQVTSMLNMFSHCSALTTITGLGSFDTSKVTNMSGMFLNDNALKSVDVSSFDTSSVTNMASMFQGCSSLTSLDVSSFDTSKTTNMSYMFYNCSALTLLDLSGWDTSNVTSMSRMFWNCSQLSSLDIRHFDTSSVTDMGYMFNQCRSLTSIDVSSFDTSNVTMMAWMFANCDNLTSLDLSHFNVSKAESFWTTFFHDRALKTLNISGWQLPKDQGNWGDFLYDTPNLELLDMSGWTDVTTDNTFTFDGTGSNKFGTGVSIKLSPAYRFNANAQEGSTYLFPASDTGWYMNGDALKRYDPVSIKEYYNSGQAQSEITWTTKPIALTGKVTFDLDGGTNPNGVKLVYDGVPVGSSIATPSGAGIVPPAGMYLTGWKHGSDLAVMPGMATAAINGEVTYVAQWAVSSVNTITLSANGGSGSAGPLYVRPGAGVMTSATGTTYLAAGAQAVPAAKLPTREGYIFAGYYAATSDGQQFSTMYVTSAGTLTVAGASYASSQAAKRDSAWYARWIPVEETSGLFAALYDNDGTESTGDYILWIGSDLASNGLGAPLYGPWVNVGQSTTSVEECAPWYSYAANITHAILEEGIQPKSMMFWFDHSNVQTIDGIETLDTSQVESMECLFNNCGITVMPDISGWDTSKVRTLDQAFRRCKGFGYANADVTADQVNAAVAYVKDWNTDSLENLNNAFGFSTATAIDLSAWNTAQVKNMCLVFNCMYNVQSIKLGDWDFSSVETLASMFNECRALIDLSIDGWSKTGNVRDMAGMFTNCVKLPSLDLSTMDTSSVTFMSNMFTGCTNLTEIEGLNSFDTSNVTSMRGMFSFCSSLKEIDVSNFDTSNVTDMDRMFAGAGCAGLDLSGFDTRKVIDMNRMFQSSQVQSLDLSGFRTPSLKSMSFMFDGCASLETIDMASFDVSHLDYYSSDDPTYYGFRATFRSCPNLKFIDMSNWTVISPALDDIEVVYNAFNFNPSIANASNISLRLSADFRFPVNATNKYDGLFQDGQWYKDGAAKANGTAYTPQEIKQFYIDGQATGPITWTTVKATETTTFTFDANGGIFESSFQTSLIVPRGTTVSLPGAAGVTPPAGKVLAGWSTNRNATVNPDGTLNPGGGKPGGAVTAQGATYTFFAIYADGPVYKRTFDFNGGTIGESGRDALWVRPGVGVYRTQAAEQPFNKRDFVLRADGVTSPLASAFPTRAGYRFAGFNNPEGTQVINSEGLLTDWDAAVAKSRNTVWTAQWDAERYTVRFELTFPEGEDSSSMSGTQPADIRTDGAQAITMPGIGDIKSEGYFLSGWSLSQDGADAFDCEAEVAVSDLIASGAAPDADGVITLYSAWTPRLSGTVPARVTLAVERMATTSVTTPVAATIQNTSGAPISVVSLEAVDQGAANAFDGATASELAAITLTLQPAGGDLIAVSLGQTAQPAQGQSALFSIGRKANLGITYGMESLSAALCEKIKDKYSGQLANLTFTVQLEASN